jgi:hypothetical protein
VQEGEKPILLAVDAESMRFMRRKDSVLPVDLEIPVSYGILIGRKHDNFVIIGSSYPVFITRAFQE